VPITSREELAKMLLIDTNEAMSLTKFVMLYFIILFSYRISFIEIRGKHLNEHIF